MPRGGVSQFPKSWFVSREFFYFQNPGRVVSPSGTFLGEIIGLSRRTGGSVFFRSCRVAASKRAKPAAWDAPTRIADLGLFWAIFGMDFFSKQLFCIVRI